mmetsp:Transcript_1367/g.3451  ORF Transcript_1367/g.3451 Transcript_1367/m.3451 type:complete len:255 (-) Transcript_1367:866-1630(-)
MLSSAVPSLAAWSFKLCICSSTWYAGTSMFSSRAISSTAMLILKSVTMSGLLMSLYLMKFSGLIIFLISSSAMPLSRMSVIIIAYFSLAWLVTRVSGTSTSMVSARLLPRASLRTPIYSWASWESTALRSSSRRSSVVRPGRTSSANSSVISGSVRFEAERMVTSKMASFPARSLFFKAAGKRTFTVLVSPTFPPSNPSTSPSIYLPGPMITSTLSPLAASGSGSPFSPSDVAMYPTMFTLQASPLAKSCDSSS